MYRSIATDTILFLTLRPPPTPTLFPYTTLFRSAEEADRERSCVVSVEQPGARRAETPGQERDVEHVRTVRFLVGRERSEEHTSELQSPYELVCRLLLEKKNKQHERAPLHQPHPP